MMAFPKLRFKNAEGAEFTSWVTSFIGDECKITTGNKDTQNKIDGGKYPFFVRSQTVERINTYSKDCEAILTSGDGVGVGKNYHYINGKFDFHQRVYCLYDFSNQLLGKYLYIYFSNYFFDRVKRLSAKNSVDSVRMDMISKMEIKLPSLVEQTKIATFLSAVDEKISQLTQKHQLLSQYKQGMMQKLFSQQIRFKADDGSEFGGWESRTLDDVVIRMQSGLSRQLNDEDTGLIVLRSNNVIDNKISYQDIKYWYLDDPQGADVANYILEDGDILVNFINSMAQIGKSALYRKTLNRKIICTTNILRLQANIQKIKSEFLNYIFQTNEYQNYIQSITKPAVNQASFTTKEFKMMRFQLPCLEEQTKIANFLSSIDQKIEVTEQQLEQAKLWKKGLLQQMFV